MDSAEIWAALAANDDRSDPPARAARAEYLVEAAEATGDVLLLVTSLQQLISAFEFNGESDRMLTPFARVLRFWDTEPGSFDSPRLHTMFWQFKWTTSQLLTLPQVPLGTIRQWLAEMEGRYRRAGYSARPVHQSRHYLASHLGDIETAQASFDAWLTEPRDVMADCEACERNAQGDWHEERGDDERALGLWEPVLGGELTCTEEPHRLLGSSLLPLLRLGRTEEARGNHLRGYRMARGRPNLRAAVGEHLAFCALTGNTARGLEILAEHKAWLDDQGENISKRRSFLEGVSVLLRQLEVQGHAELAVGSTDVHTLRTAVDAEIDATCARYDARNGNTHVSERSTRRREQPPLIDHLPLGSAAHPPRRPGGSPPGSPGGPAAYLAGSAPASGPSEWPGVTPQSGVAGVTAGAAAGLVAGLGTAGVGAAVGTGPTLDEMVTEARRLTALGHPQALAAWERISQSKPGSESGCELLPALVQAQIDRARARALLVDDPGSAVGGLRELADRLAALDAPAELLLRSRSDLAMALFLSGEREQAEELGRQVDAAVEAAYTEGALTSGDYVRLRSRPVLVANRVYQELAEAESPVGPPAEAQTEAPAEPLARQAPPTSAFDPGSGPHALPNLAPNSMPDASSLKALLYAESGLAERLGEPGQAGLYQRMLAQIELALERFEAAEERLAAAVEGFLAGECPWAAAEALGVSGHLALRRSECGLAHDFARDALRYGADLLPAEQIAQLNSLLVEALIRHGGRDGELVGAALRAAGAWEGISEPDTLHHRFTAARAYLARRQYGEAAALFEEFMPQVAVPYEAVGIAQTREQFATCLTQLGEHRHAAEQLLAAARLVQDDPENQRAHARLAWTAALALERADEPGTALPAFRRAAELWAALGALVPRVRCLRSAAWLLAWADPADENAEPEWASAATAMRAILAELEAVPAAERDDQYPVELANTEQQLARLLDNLAQAEAEGTRHNNSAEGDSSGGNPTSSTD